MDRLTNTKIATPGRVSVDWFKQFNPEEEREIRQQQRVKENKAVRQLNAAFLEYLSGAGGIQFNLASVTDQYYATAVSAIEGLKYTAKDVVEFSYLIDLAERGRRLKLGAPRLCSYLGVFFSALINNSKEENFVIPIERFEGDVEYLGYQNTKNILVLGDADTRLGLLMKGGSITVRGNATDSVGHGMTDGTIVVEGNARDRVGWRMEGGKITINGGVQNAVGQELKGGVIHVKGNANIALGEKMEAGEIIIDGNVGDYVAQWMWGGKVTINGNAGEHAGLAGSQRGEIHLNRDYLSVPEFTRGCKIFHKGKLITKIVGEKDESK